MDRRELKESLQLIAWVTIGSPVIATGIYMGLSQLSHSVADKFLSAYVSILPLPDSWKIFFMRNPFLFALIICSLFFIGFCLLDVLNEYKTKKQK
jgi:hypothetical protein